MIKKIIILVSSVVIGLGIMSVRHAYSADVVLSITIPDAKVNKVLNAYKNTYLKDVGKTNKQFVERCIKDGIKTFIFNYDSQVENDRYYTQIATTSASIVRYSVIVDTGVVQ